MLKQCSKCRDRKPLDEFYMDRQRADGRGSQCKACSRASANAYYAAHRAERAAYYQAVTKPGLKLRRAQSEPAWAPQALLCPVCCADFTQSRWGQKYCSPICRQRRRGGQVWKPKPSAKSRGYGAAHQRERRRWAPIIEAGQADCCLCEKPIEPGTPWHLDHTSDRTGYRGVAHALCNQREGGRRRHEIVRERRAGVGQISATNAA